MNRNHNNKELHLRDPSQNLESKQGKNIVDTIIRGADRTDIIKTNEEFNRAIPVFEHDLASSGISRKIRLLLVITGLASGGATNIVLDLASYFNNHPGFS